MSLQWEQAQFDAAYDDYANRGRFIRNANLDNVFAAFADRLQGRVGNTNNSTNE